LQLIVLQSSSFYNRKLTRHCMLGESAPLGVIGVSRGQLIDWNINSPNNLLLVLCLIMARRWVSLSVFV